MSVSSRRATFPRSTCAPHPEVCLICSGSRRFGHLTNLPLSYETVLRLCVESETGDGGAAIVDRFNRYVRPANLSPTMVISHDYMEHRYFPLIVVVAGGKVTNGNIGPSLLRAMDKRKSSNRGRDGRKKRPQYLLPPS